MEKHYIFDLDGTLIDSASVIAKGVYDFFDERGVEYPPDIVKIIMSRIAESIVELFCYALLHRISLCLTPTYTIPAQICFSPMNL